MKEKEKKTFLESLINIVSKLFKNSMFIEFLSFVWLAAAVFAGVVAYAAYSSYIQYGFVWNTIQGILLSVVLITSLLYLFYELLSTQKGDWFSSSFFYWKK